jgi:hypothetical protein
MRLDTYFKDKKVLGLIIIIIVCLISIPFFTYSVPYELHRTSQYKGKDAKAGETVNFQIIFSQVGGNSDKVIRIIETGKVGDWRIENNEKTIIVPPDSTRNITITITVPEDAQTRDEYYYEYELQGGYQDQDDFRVNVDNTDSYSGDPYFGSSRGMQGSSDLALSPFVFILEAIIVICIILLFVFVKKGQPNKKGKE